MLTKSYALRRLTIPQNHAAKPFDWSSAPIPYEAWLRPCKRPSATWRKCSSSNDDAIVRYDVVCADDGLHGMAAFRSDQPDLVITDIIMPEQEGIQTIAEMRKERPDAKIIAISGGGRVANTDFLKIAGAVGTMAAVPSLSIPTNSSRSRRLS